MKKFYFLLFTFYFLLSISCRQKRAGTPGFWFIQITLRSADVTAAIQAMQHLGEINGFEINPTDTSKSFHR